MADRESMNHPAGSRETEAHGEGPVETLDSYLKRATECMEVVQKMPARKFNNEQCEYLADKLEVVVKSACLFLEDSDAKFHGPGSSEDMARWVEIFKLLLALAKEIESFIQECCKDGWIQAAMTLTNVSEHVSSIGFNLELCRVAFCKECATIGCLTLDQVADINNNEVETVEKKASTDVDTLFEKVILELNSLRNENRDLASYVLQRLKRVKPIPLVASSRSSLGRVDDDRSVLGTFFKWVQVTGTRLGSGASATIYKTMWLGIPVAKKTFYGHESDDFKREAEILAGLCHLNITSMSCSAMSGHRCSIVMELMDEDLHSLMERKLVENSDLYCPPFTTLEAVDIILQIGEGMNYLHQKRIVHRDLKSFNILVKALESDIGYLHIKVADFGFSRIKESSTRYSNQTSNTGTSRWMAPEIINLDSTSGQVSTPDSGNVPKYPFKSDVFSFGMVCYEILTGDVPFSKENPNNVKRKVVKGERPDLPHHCPLELKALIKECWNQEPKERPSFATICSKLKYLKYLLMTGLSSNEDLHLSTEEPLQVAIDDTPLQALTVAEDMGMPGGGEWGDAGQGAFASMRNLPQVYEAFRTMLQTSPASLEETATAASALAQSLKGEMAEGNKRLAQSNQKRLAALVEDASLEKIWTLQLHLEKTIDPTVQVAKFLKQDKLEDAFYVALSAGDVDVVAWLCKQIDPMVVFHRSPQPLGQGILLSLVQQLGVEIEKDTKSKLRWIHEAVLSLNPRDPTVAGHVQSILEEVLSNLHRQTEIAGPGDLSDQMRLMSQVVNSMLMTM